ncbi:unnamed protein product [Microthlaspi erraticum]|uniref:Uncharacterized protein n=1 Tax=Microthlaspi erraticum TaxID=1685480 RepID=A0A6D2JJ94_9BRAS|nr:unnamed protein product [Microthlaspi erraticum]
MEAVKRQEAESKKSFCNSAAIEERFEDQVPEWMLSKPTVDCMIWPEEITQRESPIELEREDSSQRLSPRLITQESLLCLVSSKIGNCSIPTDFQIVEMRESSHRPLIFGTPFLSTVGAIFDFPNQRISFNKVNKAQAACQQARSKTKAPTPKPPKGSTKIEDEAKPRRKVRKPRSGRNMKLLFPKELIDENLEGFKEKILIARRKDLEDQDASCLHLLLSAKPYSQAKDLKQALHGRQPMRIEGEKGVKTQSAPNHWPRTRKPVEPGRNGLCSAGLLYRATKPSRGTHEQEEQAAIGRILYRNGPTVPVDPGNKRSASAEISRPTNLADQIARPRQNPSAIGPNFSRPR